MKRLLAGAVLVCMTLWPDHALALINVVGRFSFTQQISIRNKTDAPVTFVRGANVCTSQSPDSFTVNANSSATISIVQKYFDTGLDNCYATAHIIEYRDSENVNNSFRIQQYGTINQTSCLGIKINIVMWIDQAICPEATGSVLGPTNEAGCPDGADHCPPTDDGCCNEYFGFTIEHPPDFTVFLVNNTGSLDCDLTDLNKKTDRNACVINEPTPGFGKTAITLKGFCGDTAYRPAERTNVQLLCYLSGTNATGLKTWTSVTNGTTYVY